jgi:hypothetical protein
MSKWFRSEPMEYISIIMNEDAAHDCLADLGKLGAIQFTDVSTSFFVSETRLRSFSIGFVRRVISHTNIQRTSRYVIYDSLEIERLT